MFIFFFKKTTNKNLLKATLTAIYKANEKEKRQKTEARRILPQQPHEKPNKQRLPLCWGQTLHQKEPSPSTSQIYPK